MYHQMRGGVRAKSLNQVAELAKDALHGRSALWAGEIAIALPQIRSDVARLRRQNHRVRLEQIQTALRVQNFLRVRIEIANMNRQIESRQETGCAQKRNNGFDRKGSQDGQPVGKEFHLRPERFKR